MKLISAKYQAHDIEKALRPDDGWWRVSTGEAIREAACLLLMADMQETAVMELLGSVVNAMRNEYGD